MSWDWALALGAAALAAGACRALGAAVRRQSNQLRLARVELSGRRTALGGHKGPGQASRA
jgi:hypothetical protein